MPNSDPPIGVLLMAYGSPDRLEDVEAYYTHIRGGRRPSPTAVAALQARYRRIGGRSPLLEITRAQARALEAALNGTVAAGAEGFRVYVGMRHWRPFIGEAIARMAADGVRDAVGLSLAPHYSRLSVGAYIEAAQQALQELQAPLRLRFVEHWHTHPLFLEALADRVQRGLERFSPAERERLILIFTAHSLPQRILEWGDPYPRHLHETCVEVVRRVGLEATRWRFAYQSAGHTAEPWLGPDLSEVLERLARQGVPAVLVCPVGFVADHLEVLYDLEIEAREQAEGLGMHLERTDSLNDDPRLIQALRDVVWNAARGEQTTLLRHDVGVT